MNMFSNLFGNVASNSPKEYGIYQMQMILLSILIGVIIALVATIVVNFVSYKSGPRKENKSDKPNDAVVRRWIVGGAMALCVVILLYINFFITIQKITSKVFNEKATMLGSASPGIAVVTFIVFYLLLSYLLWLKVFKNYKPHTVLKSNGKILGLFSMKGK